MNNNPKTWSLVVKAVILDDSARCLLLRRSAANKNSVGQWYCRWRSAAGASFIVPLGWTTADKPNQRPNAQKTVALSHHY